MTHQEAQPLLLEQGDSDFSEPPPYVSFDDALPAYFDDEDNAHPCHPLSTILFFCLTILGLLLVSVF